jgi:uncharacterized protein
MRALGGYRAMRFVHPDLALGEGATSAGVQVSARGQLEMIDGDEAIRQSLLMLLSTSPGERVMRPEYGCNLRRLVFSPNDDTTAGLAIHYVRQAVERWEPRVDIVAIDAVRGDTLIAARDTRGGDGGPDAAATAGAPEDSLVVMLDYRVRATRRAGSLAFPVDLGSGQR